MISQIIIFGFGMLVGLTLLSVLIIKFLGEKE